MIEAPAARVSRELGRRTIEASRRIGAVTVSILGCGNGRLGSEMTA